LADFDLVILISESSESYSEDGIADRLRRYGSLVHAARPKVDIVFAEVLAFDRGFGGLAINVCPW
jgi:hypothetical protein